MTKGEGSLINTRKDNIVEDFHGTKVADPYRWLENPDSEETKQWVEAIGEQCDTYFSQTNTKEGDQKSLEKLFDYPKFFVPKKVNNRLFFQRNEGLQNQAILYMTDENEEKVIIDPNKLSDDGTVAMTNYFISNNAQYIAYATSTHGSDWQEIRVRNVETTKDELDHLQHVKFTSVAWAPDDSGFYYTRFPAQGTVSHKDENNYNKVYFHTLGTDQRNDQLIFERKDHKELMFAPMISNDKKYLIIHVFHGTATENRVYIMPLGADEKVYRLLDQQDASYRYITNIDDTFYFNTDLDATNSRVISINLQHPERENWQEVISEGRNVIHDIEYVNEKFFVAYLHDAHHQLHVFQLNGTYLYEIKLPMIGSLSGMSHNQEENEVYFGMTSYLSPTAIFHYQIDEQELTVIEKAELPMDTNQFETKQIFYPSKDGTKIPMFITHHKDVQLDGKNPVILYGYGGFNISVTPSFNPAILNWLEKGGIYAVANLRGGTEYGEEWHQAGRLGNKQNVFDDFIAAGEWLIENHYTSKEKLAIMGGSNGRLLVAACMVQRPDLFGAVLCMVPVIDMLRYHKFTIGRYWISEFGDPENPEHFPFLYAYSPLHNVKKGQKYPPVLIATAESDDRVVPAHAKKFAATLFEKASEDSTIILRLEAKAGHGLGKPMSKVIDEWVDIFAFLNKELNM